MEEFAHSLNSHAFVAKSSKDVWIITNECPTCVAWPALKISENKKKITQVLKQANGLTDKELVRYIVQ